MRSFPKIATIVAALSAVLAGCQQSDAPAPRSSGAQKPASSASDDDKTSGIDATGSKPKPKPKPDQDLGGNDDEDGEEDGKSDDADAAGGSEKKRITFPGSRGDQVPGYLWLPKGARGERHPAVLLMYGIKGNKDDGNIGRAAEILNAEGFVALTIDWPGTGERGSIGNQERITNSDVKNWTVGDYGAAYNYLAGLPEVDSSRMGYVGASMGAMTGLAFAASEQRVKAMVAIVPIPNPLWGSDDPQSTIGRVAPRPTLCISTNDNSDFSSTVCSKVGAGGEQRALPGGHELEGFRDQVVEETKTFLKAHLAK